MTAPGVLIFDSGVGGLSVSRCIHHALPSVRQVYLADNACFPYGDQPESVVVERCCTLIETALADYPVDVIVVACNTASTVVLPQLRSITDIPVVGVVPAVKPAAGLSQNRRIGLLATPATVRRPYLQQLVDDFASDCTLSRIGHPKLVRWIEDWVAGQSLPLAELDDALEPFRVDGVDTVVLGCTHYPLIVDALKALLPDVRYWVDSGEAIARRTAFLLQQGGHPLGLGEPGAQVMDAVMFSGAVPAGIDVFLQKWGMAPSRLSGGWPSSQTAVTATASA
ncbi:glutamate racemase [Marinobacter zhejiangensis]|uniref:Glutamate racemase n=1 Tax=Marinobacter zhejiangensis TaxID=488535 RepID=A0A1I4NA99_9GAMM|nr:glutamate racemase [Marinobacter zhejiangensis]SFM12431.1 glutamate racemase [Marinobacter zhejiangensis]